jgi:NAD(P)-dependent dehydrogenase (short-subunit alcohol dehydrogenase family)
MITLLVNNAGAARDVLDDPLDIDLLREDIEVNLIGPADFTNRLLSQLDSPSDIINISSMGASLCEPIEDSWNVPAYKISKAGLNMFTRTMSYQLRDKGVTVSSLDPGWVRTDMGGEDAPINPEEVAEEIFDLASRKVETGQFWLHGKKRSW